MSELMGGSFCVACGKNHEHTIPNECPVDMASAPMSADRERLVANLRIDANELEARDVLKRYPMFREIVADIRAAADALASPAEASEPGDLALLSIRADLKSTMERVNNMRRALSEVSDARCAHPRVTAYRSGIEDCDDCGAQLSSVYNPFALPSRGNATDNIYDTFMPVIRENFASELTDAALDEIERGARERIPAGGYAQRSAREIAMVQEIRRLRATVVEPPSDHGSFVEARAGGLRAVKLAITERRKGEPFVTLDDVAEPPSDRTQGEPLMPIEEALQYVRVEEIFDDEPGRTQGDGEWARLCARCVRDIGRVRVTGRKGGTFCSEACADESDYEAGVSPAALATRPDPAAAALREALERIHAWCMDASLDSERKRSVQIFAACVATELQRALAQAPPPTGPRAYLHMMTCNGCGCEMPPHMAAGHPETCGKEPVGILSAPPPSSGERE